MGCVGQKQKIDIPKQTEKSPEVIPKEETKPEPKPISPRDP